MRRGSPDHQGDELELQKLHLKWLTCMEGNLPAGAIRRAMEHDVHGVLQTARAHYEIDQRHHQQQSHNAHGHCPHHGAHFALAAGARIGRIRR